MTTIMGNISRAAETRTVKVKGVDTLVTDFNIAENRGFGENQKTVYWRVTIWRDRGAKLAPHLTLGRPVYLEGDAEASAYINKEGKAVAQMEMSNPFKVQLIGKKPVAPDGTVFEGDEVQE